MKTSAISNPVNFTSGTAAATKSSADPVDTPFSQVLSREMASPPKAPEQAKSNSAESSNSAQPAGTDTKPNGANDAEQRNAATTTAPRNKAAAKARAAEGDKPKGEVGDQDQEDDASALSPASAELLALVANLTQPAAAAAKPAKDADGKTGVKDAEQLPDAAVTAQAGMVTAQAGMQLPDAGAAAQAGAQALPPSVAAQQSGLQRDQANATLTAAAATSLMRRGTASGKETAVQDAAKTVAQGVKQETAQGVNKRVAPDAAAKGNTSEPKEFDAKLAQATNVKTESDNNPARIAADRAKLPDTQSASGMTAAKNAPDLQQPGGMTPDIGALPGVSHMQMQPAPAAPAVPANAADMLAPPVGGKGWDQALGQKIVWMVGAELQSASLTLNPPDLGPLHVVLNVSDNQATANFTAAQPEVRHALEAALPKLREMLGEAGIQLGQANVSAGTPNNQQNAFEQPQPSSRHNTAAAGNESANEPARVVRSQTVAVGRGLVDTFA